MIAHQTQQLRVTRPRAARSSTYTESVEQLSRMSVRKYYQAYRDVDWDAPENQLDRADPRFVLGAHTALGVSPFYRALPPGTRAQLGLDMLCQVLKFGIGFEFTFSRGLLEFASTLPNRDLSYRCALHEVIEESQHSLMFQEFINRSGCDPQPISGFDAFMDRRIARSGANFPELFFCCALAGELFIDHDNRDTLRGNDVHPLLRTILQFHVTEEARHLHFVRQFLIEHLPKLSFGKRRFLQLVLPTLLRDAQRMMLSPAPGLVRAYGIPGDTLRTCYGPGSAHRERVERIAQSVFALFGDDYAQRTRVFSA